MSHEWLVSNSTEEQLELPQVKMSKGHKPVLQVDAQDNNNNIIASLNKIIKEKDEEISKLRQEN